ncbi:MAG: hypothetical protein ACE5HI_14980 [bacterium]
MQVNVYHTGLFSKSRCSFEIFEGNDYNPKTKKIGIQCHNRITAFFLRLFGKKTKKIQTEEGKTIYLNRRSYNEWKSWRQSELPNSNSKPLSLKAIIDYHKAAKQSRKEAKIAKKNAKKAAKRLKIKIREENTTRKAATAFLSGITRKVINQKIEIRKSLRPLHEEKKSLETALEKLRNERDEIEQQCDKALERLRQSLAETKAEHDNLRQPNVKQLGRKAVVFIERGICNAFRTKRTRSKETSAKQQLDQKLGLLSADMKNIEKQIRAMQEKKIDLLSEQDRQIAEKDKQVQELADKIREQEAKLQALGGKVKRIAAKTSRIHATQRSCDPIENIRNRPGSKDGCSLSAINEAKNKNTESNSIKKHVLSDIKEHTHKDLKKVMRILFEKFDKGLIESWKCDSNGEFELTAKMTGKLWCQPIHDNGEFDSQTPKGAVVLLCANKEKKLRGKLDKKTASIIIYEGFSVYCRYKKKLGPFTKTGEADGHFKVISYDPKKKTTSVTVAAKDRQFGIKNEDPETKKLRTVIREWREGVVIPSETDHEAFLNKQEAKG